MPLTFNPVKVKFVLRGDPVAVETLAGKSPANPSINLPPLNACWLILPLKLVAV